MMPFKTKDASIRGCRICEICEICGDKDEQQPAREIKPGGLYRAQAIVTGGERSVTLGLGNQNTCQPGGLYQEIRRRAPDKQAVEEVKPSRLILRGRVITEGVAPGYEDIALQANVGCEGCDVVPRITQMTRIDVRKRAGWEQQFPAIEQQFSAINLGLG